MFGLKYRSWTYVYIGCFLKENGIVVTFYSKLTVKKLLQYVKIDLLKLIGDILVKRRVILSYGMSDNIL